MTKRTNAGLIDAGNFDRHHTEEFAFRISKTDLVAVSNRFLEAAKTYTTDPSSPTVYNDHHSPLAEKTVLICRNTNAHLQFTIEPMTTNSISFPPFYCREQVRPPAPDIFI